jgi:hypothetical protein
LPRCLCVVSRHVCVFSSIFFRSFACTPHVFPHKIDTVFCASCFPCTVLLFLCLCHVVTLLRLLRVCCLLHSSQSLQMSVWPPVVETGSKQKSQSRTATLSVARTCCCSVVGGEIAPSNCSCVCPSLSRCQPLYSAGDKQGPG